MKRVRIDFAPPGLRRTLYHTRAGWGLAWTALVLCAAAGAAGWRYHQAATAHEAQLAQLRARAAVPALIPVALRQPPLPEAQANAVNAGGHAAVGRAAIARAGRAQANPAHHRRNTHQRRDDRLRAGAPATGALLQRHPGTP
jgi:hypothetical protein